MFLQKVQNSEFSSSIVHTPFYETRDAQNYYSKTPRSNSRLHDLIFYRLPANLDMYSYKYLFVSLYYLDIYLFLCLLREPIFHGLHWGFKAFLRANLDLQNAIHVQKAGTALVQTILWMLKIKHEVCTSRWRIYFEASVCPKFTVTKKY